MTENGPSYPVLFSFWAAFIHSCSGRRVWSIQFQIVKPMYDCSPVSRQMKMLDSQVLPSSPLWVVSEQINDQTGAKLHPQSSSSAWPKTKLLQEAPISKILWCQGSPNLIPPYLAGWQRILPVATKLYQMSENANYALLAKKTPKMNYF